MGSNSEDLLSFKNFSNSAGSSEPPEIKVNSPQRTQIGRGTDPLQALIYDMAEGAKVLSVEEIPYKCESRFNDPDKNSSKRSSFLTIEYYQQFFNVDTFIVLDRIASSIIPKRAPINYLRSQIGTNPDFYGPFWIVITLIFSIAISGNIASYLQTTDENINWRYNFHLVSYAASSIFVYACFVPGAVWALMKYSLKPVEEGFETEMATYTPTLLSLMCIYGYSLAIYIPVSILWLIQVSILQWLLLLTAAFASGSVLIAVMAPALRNSKLSLFLVIGILVAHLLLAAGFMLYFFHVPGTPSNAVAITKDRMQENVVFAPKNVTG